MTYQLVVPQVLSIDANGITYAPEGAAQTQFFVPGNDDRGVVEHAAESAIKRYGEAKDLGLSPIPPAIVIWGTTSKPAGEWLPPPSAPVAEAAPVT